MYLKNPIFSVIEILLSPIFFFWLLCQSRRGSSDTPSDPIPPNIFQTWKSEDDMTEKQKASQKSWRDKNPGWCYSLYDDADCDEFVKAFYPKYYKVWPDLTPVERADLWRYLIIHKYGGVYADIDTVCLRSLNNVAERNIEMIIFFETFKFEPPFVFPMWVQWFFGSVPNNPMMLEVCDAIVLRLSESPPVDWKKSRPGLRTLYITGPFVWSKIINGFWQQVSFRGQIRIYWPIQVLTWVHLRVFSGKQNSICEKVFVGRFVGAPVHHYGQNSWR